MLFMNLAIVAIVSYLLGSFNTAVVISRTILKDDIRGHGSGNAGATNALRVMGKKLAALVAAGDILKGVIAILFAGWLFYGSEQFYFARILAAAFAIIGHVYPVFFGFKGGKGVATTGAMVLMLDWRAFLICATIFILTVAVTRLSSLGSMLGVISVPFSFWFFNYDAVTITASAMIALFVVFLHRENIKRLFKGTENRVSFRSKNT
ncbi:MAG: glycerol-3-phosphate 1-O-acyltransferase PlsY [Oscillospiraceae bacterium]|nr:glycerol-3-phosphate 1-O-acyltransferase PlsY [Oscillospiraceae bacterium]